MKLFQLTLVAPCLNEEKNVVELSERFFAATQHSGVKAEIVFVDDGSEDGTWENLLAIQARYRGCVQLARHSTNRGIPESWKTGVGLAAGQVVCLIDSDLQNPPESVLNLLAEYEANEVDLVRGVRKPSSRQPIFRVLFSRGLNLVLNVIFGMNSSDNKSGFVLASRDTMRMLVDHRERYRHFQTFIGVAARARSLRVIEVPTPFDDRRSGKSFLSGRSAGVIREVYQDIPVACREFGWRFSRKEYK